MVYMFLADGFEEAEAICPADLIRRSRTSLTLVSIGKNQEVTGAHGMTLTADTTMEKLKKNKHLIDDLEMVIFPGGMPGAKHLDECPDIDWILSLATEKGAYIAAICAAPMIPGHRGLLSGHKATCYPSFEDQLEGAEVTDVPVVCDGKFITAKAMGAAIPFGLELVRVLCGLDEARKIRESIFF